MLIKISFDNNEQSNALGCTLAPGAVVYPVVACILTKTLLPQYTLAVPGGGFIYAWEGQSDWIVATKDQIFTEMRVEILDQYPKRDA